VNVGEEGEDAPGVEIAAEGIIAKESIATNRRYEIIFANTCPSNDVY
jgi:hypothetical protein